MSQDGSNNIGFSGFGELEQESRVETASEVYSDRSSSQDPESQENLELNYGAEEHENNFVNYNDFEEYFDILSKDHLDHENVNADRREVLEDEFDEFLEDITVGATAPVGSSDAFSEMDELLKGFDVKPFYKEISREDEDSLYITEFTFHYEDGSETVEKELDAVMSESGAILLDQETGSAYNRENEDEEELLVRTEMAGETEKHSSGYKTFPTDTSKAERYATWINAAEEFIKNFNSFMINKSGFDPYANPAERESDISYIADAVDMDGEDIEVLEHIEENLGEIEIGNNDHSGNGSGARGPNYAQEISTKLNRLKTAGVIDYTPKVSLDENVSKVKLPKEEGQTGFAEYAA